MSKLYPPDDIIDLGIAAIGDPKTRMSAEEKREKSEQELNRKNRELRKQQHLQKTETKQMEDNEVKTHHLEKKQDDESKQKEQDQTAQIHAIQQQMEAMTALFHEQQTRMEILQKEKQEQQQESQIITQQLNDVYTKIIAEQDQKHATEMTTMQAEIANLKLEILKAAQEAQQAKSEQESLKRADAVFEDIPLFGANDQQQEAQTQQQQQQQQQQHQNEPKTNAENAAKTTDWGKHLAEDVKYAQANAMRQAYVCLNAGARLIEGGNALFGKPLALDHLGRRVQLQLEKGAYSDSLAGMVRDPWTMEVLSNPVVGLVSTFAMDLVGTHLDNLCELEGEGLYGTRKKAQEEQAKKQQQQQQQQQQQPTPYPYPHPYPYPFNPYMFGPPMGNNANLPPHQPPQPHGFPNGGGFQGPPFVAYPPYSPHGYYQPPPQTQQSDQYNTQWAERAKNMQTNQAQQQTQQHAPKAHAATPEQQETQRAVAQEIAQQNQEDVVYDACFDTHGVTRFDEFDEKHVDVGIVGRRLFAMTKETSQQQEYMQSVQDKFADQFRIWAPMQQQITEYVVGYNANEQPPPPAVPSYLPQ